MTLIRASENSQMGNKVAACAKHFVGDGSTLDGSNENNTIINREGLMNIHMAAYKNAMDKGVSTVMISYSSRNGVKMHANQDLITGYLKNTLKIQGFVISNCEGIDRITTPAGSDYYYSVKASILAGLDMIMVPNNYEQFISILTGHVNSGVIPMSRIDDTVTRILRVKFAMGLFENPYADPALAEQLGKQEHRDLAREAVRKSLVLLKNGKTPSDAPLLPLPKKAPKIKGKRGNITDSRDEGEVKIQRDVRLFMERNCQGKRKGSGVVVS